MNHKVGIITSTQSFGDNYGAILQAYALSRVLREEGYDPCIIKYKRCGEYLRGKAPLMRRLKGTLICSEFSLRARYTLLVNYLFKRNARKRFDQFSDSHLRFYNEQYVGFAELTKDPPPYDRFVVGSDQVWNPVIHDNRNDPGYFLDFVPKGKKRVAYAPSIGVDRIPDHCMETLGPFIEKMDAVSVREKTGAQIIKEACGKDVPVVLDPTLLLTSEKWDEVSRPCDTLPDRYILCYKFGNSEVMDRVLKKLSRKYKLPVVAVPASPETKFKTNYTIGPGEFLHAVKNAALVCSDSFHATVFSVLYKRPFFTFSRVSATASGRMNARMEDFLDMLQMQNRYITKCEDVDFEHPFELDYGYADGILQTKRESNRKFLVDALGGEQ